MDTPGTLTDITLQLVDLDETFELRRAVLRPWLTPAEAAATYAGAGEHFHVGALQGGPQGKRLVSTAGFMAEAQPDYAEDFGPEPWRLRGMASDPAVQGRGLGGRVLEFGIAELARRLAARGEDSAVVWCNGRTGAQTFYERHGFRPIGALFETPGTGPHYVFWRRVAARSSGGT
ncbi:GNAT family N-acetyltransferase [Pelagibius marinus]|uniref:GNAT family N-acetyltransferase n=1 Tax=Pelagibius marinus TaxID=2762760 RepID=UPI0018724268|nr:GNAT family N-acetyltransferase [Pelagibius marinus]